MAIRGCGRPACISEQYTVTMVTVLWCSLNRMVLDYMVHYGYCNSAQVFAGTTDQQVDEEVASIRNRQSECNRKCMS